MGVSFDTSAMYDRTACAAFNTASVRYQLNSVSNASAFSCITQYDERHPYAVVRPRCGDVVFRFMRIYYCASLCAVISKIRRKPSPVGRGYKAGREALYSIAVWLSIYVFNVSSVAPPAVQAK